MVMIGNDIYNLQRPMLNLIHVEDDLEWIDQLGFLKNAIEDWPLHKIGQFHLKVHHCSSVESFARLAGEMLARGELVYTTLDLDVFRYNRDKKTDPGAGQQLLDWCLERKNSFLDQTDRLEFCLISDHDGILDLLGSETAQGKELQRFNIKRIYKSEIGSRTSVHVKLMEVVRDIRHFVRRHIRFCTFPIFIQVKSEEERIPVWFGQHPSLQGLLAKADQISSLSARVYLLFADAGGYELDWAQLCCHLSGRPLKVLDFEFAMPHIQDWDQCFYEPPPALFVRNIEFASSRGCDLNRILSDSEFFDRARKEKSLVFFQFPFFKTQLSISGRLDLDEVKVLEASLRQVFDNKGPPHPSGIGFAYEDHPQVITFPAFSRLREMAAVEHSLGFQLLETNRQEKCEIVIDPELSEVLASIPWDEQQGLQNLRILLKNAHRICRKRGGGTIRFEDFKRSSVRSIFDGKLGFLVRGHRLYRLLEDRHSRSESPGEGTTRPSRQVALEKLEILLALYRDLDGLMRIVKKLSKELGGLPFDPTTFSEADYLALAEVFDLLKELFETPRALQNRIEKFKDNLDQDNWEAYYPAVQSCKGLAAMENLRLTWPFTRLHLHPSVDAYLRQHGIRPKIEKDFEDYVRRYPDIEAQWRELKEQRHNLLEDIERRENQRLSAETYVRDAETQPINIYLIPRKEKQRGDVSFARTFWSFLIFNSYLALCEGFYVFGSLVPKLAAQSKYLLNSADNGPAIHFLESYFRALDSLTQRQDSIFDKWLGCWVDEEDKSDTLRLISDLVHTLMNDEKYRGRWDPERRKKFLRLTRLDFTESGAFTTALLEFLREIRNAFYKIADADFEQRYGLRLEDLMRRITAAVTSDYRLGWIADDGRVLRLWSKSSASQLHTAPLVRASQGWGERLVVAREISRKDGTHAYLALFPIDEVLRVHPDNASFYAYNKPRKDWRNLAHLGSKSADFAIVPEAAPWLLNLEQLNQTALWRSVFDKSTG